MRVVVSSNSDEGLKSSVSHHFGRCPFFTVVDVENHSIQSVQVVDNPFYSSHVPGQVPAFVRKLCADVMLSGGMGRRAISMFGDYGIQCVTGASGLIEMAVSNFLAGELDQSAPCAESQSHSGNCGSDAEDPDARRLRERAAQLLDQMDDIIVRLPDDNNGKE